MGLKQVASFWGAKWRNRSERLVSLFNLVCRRLFVEAREETRTETRPSTGWGLDLDQLSKVPYRPRVLIIDDEPDTIFLLKEVLRKAGFDVTGAASCNEALQKCSVVNPDLILLDLLMPEVDGWMTFDHLRRVTDAPVMILTALSNKELVVRGLQVGADEYMTKPFHNGELATRAQKILQRCAPRDPHQKLFFPDISLRIDAEVQAVTLREETFTLPGKEFSVLDLLARNAPNMVTYRNIALHVWGEDTPDTRKRIKYLIFLLRRKLEENPSEPHLIENVDRVGYKLQTQAR
ncbi:MAG: response regulator transcription factor [Bacteroidales bacterium]